jgi:hypothetical protein
MPRACTRACTSRAVRTIMRSRSRRSPGSTAGWRGGDHQLDSRAWTALGNSIAHAQRSDRSQQSRAFGRAAAGSGCSNARAAVEATRRGQAAWISAAETSPRCDRSHGLGGRRRAATSLKPSSRPGRTASRRLTSLMGAPRARGREEASREFQRTSRLTVPSRSANRRARGARGDRGLRSGSSIAPRARPGKCELRVRAGSARRQNTRSAELRLRSCSATQSTQARAMTSRGCSRPRGRARFTSRS